MPIYNTNIRFLERDEDSFQQDGWKSFIPQQEDHWMRDCCLVRTRIGSGERHVIFVSDLVRLRLMVCMP
jgi:hypothetical protein